MSEEKLWKRFTLKGSLGLHGVEFDARKCEWTSLQLSEIGNIKNYKDCNDGGGHREARELFIGMLYLRIVYTGSSLVLHIVKVCVTDTL